jgi:putative hydrolase of the HAD superfamily
VPKPSSPVWLFDLDNTLHDASHRIFPAISANMNTYIARVLGDGVTPASRAAVDAARIGYWKRYGATLLGMIRHHRVDAADFLRETHDIGALQELVRFERGLERLLRRLPGKKILRTTAPAAYTHGVVRHLGLQRRFAHHVAIEDMRVHGQLRPKPSTLMLRRLLRRHRLAPHRCILVEDTLVNLKHARKVGVRTAWVTQYLRPNDPAVGNAIKTRAKRPGYVDVKVKSVLRLPRYMHRLTRSDKN